MARRLYIHMTGLLLIMAALVTGCSQSNASKHDLQLLTSNPWQYEQAGFSTDDKQDDESASFNALAPALSGSNNENFVIFHSDGTGSDNRLPFTWAFQNNDSILFFQDRYYMVKSLTNNRLVMYADQKRGPIHTHYTIVLKH
jgi:hypothetical protein